MKNSVKHKDKPGFSLLELMVAMAVTAIIATVLVTITGIATDAWTRGSSQVRAARQAKAMLDTMASDFESLVSRSGNDFEWLYAEMDNVSNAPAVRSGSVTSAAQLIFTTAVTDRYNGQVVGNPGDVSTVGYELAFQDPIQGSAGGSDDSRTFIAYRKLVDPDETFEKILGETDIKTAFSSYTITEPQNFVCENVYQVSVTFEVEIQENNTSPRRVVRVTLDNNSGGKFHLTGKGIKLEGLTPQGATVEQVEAGRLRGVELSISVLSDAAISRIAATSGGLNEADYARSIYNYSRHVEVPGM